MIEVLLDSTSAKSSVISLSELIKNVLVKVLDEIVDIVAVAASNTELLPSMSEITNSVVALSSKLQLASGVVEVLDVVSIGFAKVNDVNEPPEGFGSFSIALFESGVLEKELL